MRSDPKAEACELAPRPPQGGRGVKCSSRDIEWLREFLRLGFRRQDFKKADAPWLRRWLGLERGSPPPLLLPIYVLAEPEYVPPEGVWEDDEGEWFIDMGDRMPGQWD